MNRRRLTGHRLSVPAGPAADPLADVAAYWRFDVDGDDAIGSLDLTPNTSTSGLTAGSVTGKNNNCLNVTGTTLQRAYARTVAAGLGALQIGDAAFSFCAWSKITSSQLTADCSPGIAQLGDYPAATPNYGWALGREFELSGSVMRVVGRTYKDLTGGVDIGNAGNFTNLDLDGVTFNDDAWHFYAISRAAGADSRFRVYFDDQMIESTSVGVGSVASFFAIGNNNAPRDLYSSTGFRGGIDEAAFWTRELTTEEVAALYNAGTGTFLP